ncbi:MAG: ABC transporter ATP-binding protein/permease, partial [Mycobacterium sp.]
MELFKPSISWGHALAESLSWIAIAWAISAVCLLVVLGLLRLATPWGRQFWRITDGYFTGRDSARVWLMLGVLLLSVVIGVRLSVLFSYQANDLNSSIQTAVQGMAIHDDAVKESGVHGFWMSIFHFSIMAALYIARGVFDIYLVQRF